MTDEEEHPYKWAVDSPPVGRWTTPLHPLVYDDLRFDEDGSGLFVSHSGMLGERQVPFEWRHEGPGRLRIRELCDDEFPPRGKDERDVVIHYRADWINNETGEGLAVLRDIDQRGFWMALSPVFFVGKVSGVGSLEPDVHATDVEHRAKLGKFRNGLRRIFGFGKRF